MHAANKSNVALCPDCEKQIRIGGAPKKGKKLMCPRCEAYLRIVSLDPPELDWDLDDYDEWDPGADHWDADDDWR
jgi:hypothetical protein